MQSFNVKHSEFWWLSVRPKIKLIDSRAKKEKKAFTDTVIQKKREDLKLILTWKDGKRVYDVFVQNIFELHSSVFVDLLVKYVSVLPSGALYGFSEGC